MRGRKGSTSSLTLELQHVSVVGFLMRKMASKMLKIHIKKIQSLQNQSSFWMQFLKKTLTSGMNSESSNRIKKLSLDINRNFINYFKSSTEVGWSIKWSLQTNTEILLVMYGIKLFGPTTPKSTQLGDYGSGKPKVSSSETATLRLLWSLVAKIEWYGAVLVWLEKVLAGLRVHGRIAILEKGLKECFGMLYGKNRSSKKTIVNNSDQ